MFWYKKKVEKKIACDSRFNPEDYINDVKEDMDRLILMVNAMSARLDTFHQIAEDLQVRDTDAIELKETLIRLLEALGFANIYNTVQIDVITLKVEVNTLKDQIRSLMSNKGDSIAQDYQQEPLKESKI